MNILAVGDIVGESGVRKLKEILPKIKKELSIDFCIVNAENSAGGMGITTKIFYELLNLGVNSITMGNHTWGKKDIFTFIEDEHMVRPANYSRGVVGKGYRIYKCKDRKICVINLIGRTDIGVQSDNPFSKVEDIIKQVKNEVDIIMVDFHAEATAEKIAMKYFLDGEVTGIFGTHTHVQTADEEITSKGTAYITDLGMTGPKESVIGMDKEVAKKRFLTSLPERYKLADDENCIFNACIIKVEDNNCRAIAIDRINIR